MIPPLPVAGKVYRDRRADQPVFRLVLHSDQPAGVRSVAVDSWGMRLKRSRPGWKGPVVFVRDFEPYRPCRWVHECLAQATTVVVHTNLGDYDVCDVHAVEHQRWWASTAGLPSQQWPDEPRPECMCPDTHRLQALPPPDYCPEHGPPASRGTDVDPGQLVLTDAVTASVVKFAAMATP